MDWKNLIRNIAPTIGAALGGPLAGTAVKFLAEGLLGKPDASEEEVAQAILGASPEQLLQMKKMDVDFKIRMRELGINVFKLEVEDRASARELAKIDMRPHIVISAVYSIGYFLVLYLFITKQIVVGDDVRDAFNQIIGVLTAAQIMIMQFWFGSSSGSKEKDALKGT